MQGEALPRLTKPQMARLVEIGDEIAAHACHKPATTDALARSGAIEWYLGHRTGQLRLCRLTPLGVRVLAGLPGDEFDRFRALLARAETGAVDD